MSFFNELKRRNVFRVGAAYLVVAWLLVQVVDTLGDLFEWPNVFGQGVVILLAIGFPIAIVVSWIYEMTPEGITTQEAVDAGASTTSGRKLNAVIIAALLLAVAFMAMDNYVLDEAPAADTAVAEDLEFEPVVTVEDKSIAVLPFANVSADPDQEYFADGLTDELLNKLARVRDLQVAGRASSYYYKDKNEDLRVIGETLNVANILQGSVRKAGNDIRINAQLVNAADGFQLWSDSFDFELDDVFAVQDRIAEQVTRALQITLAAGVYSQPGNTRNVEAYDLLMQSRYEINRFTEESFREGIRLAREAVRLDPGFARGWLALRGAYSQASTFLPGEETGELVRLAEEAGNRARELAPEMSVFVNEEIVRGLRGNDYLAGWQAVQQALGNDLFSELDATWWQALFHGLSGQNDQAMVYLQRLRRLDPLSDDAYFNLATVLFHMGRNEEAREVIAAGFRVEPASGVLNSLLAKIERAESRWAEAAEVYERLDAVREMSLELDPYLIAGDSQEGLQAVNRYREEHSLSPAQAMWLARYASRLGDGALAVELMYLGLENQGGYQGLNLWDPEYETARQHPDFKGLVDTVGFVDFWRATGDWGDYCRPLEGNDDFECF